MKCYLPVYLLFIFGMNVISCSEDKKVKDRGQKRFTSANKDGEVSSANAAVQPKVDENKDLESKETDNLIEESVGTCIYKEANFDQGTLVKESCIESGEVTYQCNENKWIIIDDTCSNSETLVDGVCDTKINGCAEGQLLDLDDSDSDYLWQCQGKNGGKDSSICSTPIPLQAVNGVCGNTKNSCLYGDVSIEGIDNTSKYHQWKCLGSNGGSDSSICKVAGDCPSGIKGIALTSLSSSTFSTDRCSQDIATQPVCYNGADDYTLAGTPNAINDVIIYNVGKSYDMKYCGTTNKNFITEFFGVFSTLASENLKYYSLPNTILSLKNNSDLAHDNMLIVQRGQAVGAAGGNDTYILSPSTIESNEDITISDATGINKVQLYAGLKISSSRVASNTLMLNLSNGASITVLSASEFSYETGGNLLSGKSGNAYNFRSFALNVLGVSVPTSGVVDGGAVEIK
ncbi:MAG: hypothetical protein R3B45_01020 [Bdellovibrionota bacterium]